MIISKIPSVIEKQADIQDTSILTKTIPGTSYRLFPAIFAKPKNDSAFSSRKASPISLWRSSNTAYLTFARCTDTYYYNESSIYIFKSLVKASLYMSYVVLNYGFLDFFSYRSDNLVGPYTVQKNDVIKITHAAPSRTPIIRIYINDNKVIEETESIANQQYLNVCVRLDIKNN